ncbi:MAG TPA: hypothetical protein VFE62_06285, partial [Gemmataceae bacterium]|nr:hypothetical protein [Gemmataceae bacterium]
QGEHERAAANVGDVANTDGIAQSILHDPRGLTPVLYGLDRIDKLFTDRQIAVLSTLSDLIVEAHATILDHSGKVQDRDGAEYAESVATYLSLALGRTADLSSNLTTWIADLTAVRNTFSRNALPMTWDFVETNVIADKWNGAVEWVCKCLEALPPLRLGQIRQAEAQQNNFPPNVVFSSDPPYYDNIGYADMSDFFYVWHRRSLRQVLPALFRRLSTPKDAELVASPYRHGGRANAERFFMNGMKDALLGLSKASPEGNPLSIYYAFKQSEMSDDGVTSAGWASFLQAIHDAGLLVDGTWPIRTERSVRTRGIGSNALASSIVLVCRTRPTTASVATRAEFIRSLKREMPEAINAIRKAGVGPVDMQQSVIGPGMGIFSRYSKVLEDDDRAMTVRTALSLINRVWEEIENELDTAFDSETQVALAWYATYGFDARTSGELITLANAKNIPSNVLFSSGVFKDMKGKAGLIPREELPAHWQPSTDKSLTVWECVQHTARTLRADDGGGEAAARLVAQMGPKGADARALAYRLFEIATKKGWSNEALVYNELAQEWPKLEDLAPSTSIKPSDAQGSLL